MMRGALLHRYPNKNGIIVGPSSTYRDRIKCFQSLVCRKKARMRGGLSMIYGEMEEWFPMTLEFTSSMRRAHSLH